ncbi:hypothetical protein [Neptuniibacter sp. QD37_11]|uniref:hypothetical protein n=1 Tax=Neptuniibacter sp. QD37_11 TaxID=3398209 RepID=UPI0039F4EBE4
MSDFHHDEEVGYSIAESVTDHVNHVLEEQKKPFRVAANYLPCPKEENPLFKLHFIATEHDFNKMCEKSRNSGNAGASAYMAGDAAAFEGKTQAEITLDASYLANQHLTNPQAHSVEDEVYQDTDGIVLGGPLSSPSSTDAPSNFLLDLANTINGSEYEVCEDDVVKDTVGEHLDKWEFLFISQVNKLSKEVDQVCSLN